MRENLSKGCPIKKRCIRPATHFTHVFCIQGTLCVAGSCSMVGICAHLFCVILVTYRRIANLFISLYNVIIRSFLCSSDWLVKRVCSQNAAWWSDLGRNFRAILLVQKQIACDKGLVLQEWVQCKWSMQSWSMSFGEFAVCNSTGARRNLLFIHENNRTCTLAETLMGAYQAVT